MYRFIFSVLVLFFCAHSIAQDLCDLFLRPPAEAKPIVIWQWMDGMVNKEAITRDLIAFKQAGIGGVQNFQVGGKIQTLLSDTTVSIGSEKWQELMRFAIEECARLGLSFGTHNCPGWSSSGYPSVRPKDSMQKLVWSETAVDISSGKEFHMLVLPTPDTSPSKNIKDGYDYSGVKGIDTIFNFYRDIAVLAIPKGSVVVKKRNIIDLTQKMDSTGKLSFNLPEGKYSILRIGHTTNGQTNCATSPLSGVGLECDKMSREAVRNYWSGYPSMLLRLAGRYAGTTFTRIEIDSYEAGTQDWTPLMREEFWHRRGYDLLPWLISFTGRMVESKEATLRFKCDFEKTITELFAECYYGEMSRMVHEIPGMKLLAQPYGPPLDTDKCVEQLKEDLICTEFWVHLGIWGDMNVPKVATATLRNKLPLLYAEGFTCMPVKAWQDAPDALKPVCDRVFAQGVNMIMLHAAALNPWASVRPGMSFGYWGTQFQPTQTWWNNGGRAFFAYMARCQALLQQGENVKGLIENDVVSHCHSFDYAHRKMGDADIYFFTNLSDTAFTDTISLSVIGRIPKFFDAVHSTISEASCWQQKNGRTEIKLSLPAHGSIFVVLQQISEGKTGSQREQNVALSDTILLVKNWMLHFPESTPIQLDTLCSWTELTVPDMRYFSGTAIYETDIQLKRRYLKEAKQIVLDLDKVNNVAEVYINGRATGDTIWTVPFQCDITHKLCPGKNHIEIRVTNVWANRMIGDEQYPDDAEWSEPFIYTYASGNPTVGSFLKKEPEWLKQGSKRPVKERHTLSNFKFFRADSPLLPSGLTGKVKMIRYKNGK